MESPVDDFISRNSDKEKVSRDYINAIKGVSTPIVFATLFGPLVMIILILIFINNAPVLILVLGVYLLISISLVFWRYRIEVEFKELKIRFPHFLRYSTISHSLFRYFYLISLIPVFGIVLSAFPLTWYVEAGFSILVGALVIFIVTWNPAVRRMLKTSRELGSEEIESRIRQVTEENGMHELKPLIVDGKSLKIANAFTIGMLHPRICVTDYLYEGLSPDETFALLCHELGHVKNRDTLKRGTSVISLVAVVGAMAILSILSLDGIVHIGLPLKVVLVVFPPIVVIGVFLFPLVSSIFMRRQEIRADRFASRYSSYDTIVIALLKTRYMNLLPLRFKGRTHPSLAVRMQRLRKFEDEQSR